MTKTGKKTVPTEPYVGEFKLGDTRFRCLPGTGRTIMRAGEIAAGNEAMFFPATCHLLLRTDDDKQWAPDQFLDLSWEQFSDLAEKMRGLGFTLA